MLSRKLDFPGKLRVFYRLRGRRCLVAANMTQKSHPITFKLIGTSRGVTSKKSQKRTCFPGKSDIEKMQRFNHLTENLGLFLAHVLSCCFYVVGADPEIRNGCHLLEIYLISLYFNLFDYYILIFDHLNVKIWKYMH